MSPHEQDPVAPQGIDLERPNVARVYDWYLGGTANWAIDREFGKKILAAWPLIKPAAMANRLFLHRAVRRLVRLGVRQFVDIGAGVPTMGPTHEVADEVAPGSKVVYIDNEPVAVAHSQMLLEKHGDPARHAVINADLRNPNCLWPRVMQTGLIDITQPIALLTIAVLHFHQPDPDGVDMGPTAMARYRELLPSGSYLAISHTTADGAPEELERTMKNGMRLYENTSSRLVYRTRQEIQELFGDFELIEPDMDWAPSWLPEETSQSAPVVKFDSPANSLVWVGVGRKP